MPAGVSLMLVPLYLAGELRGLFALGPLMAALGVVALYGLAWRYLTERRSVALLAAALLATLPRWSSSPAGSAATCRR
jgi:hypothetical protein